MMPDTVRQWLKQKDAESYPIITNPSAHFKSVYHIKDATWETMEMPGTYGVIQRYPVAMYHPAQDILLIPNAHIAPSSEVVYTKDGAVWDKYYLPMFPYMIASDSNRATNDAEAIRIRKPDTTIPVKGACISLFGVWETLWVHFLVQFLPKLYYAEEAGLLDQEITVIMPNYKDSHINQLIDDVLQKHPKCQVIRAENTGVRVEYVCEQLYWIPTASAVSNDYPFPMLYHNVLPAKVGELLHHKVFEKYMNSVKISDDSPKKLYLVRRGGYRGAKNIDEIEAFFKARGFVFVEPHKVTLEEKVSLFRNAKIIAGPQSSAWSGAMLCDHAKGLMITPVSWTIDALVGYNILPEECYVLQVPGNEIMNGSSQMDYTVDMGMVERAYNQLLEMEI